MGEGMLLFLLFLPVHNLSQPGTFAGNDAIVAFARSHQLRVVIHQLNTPLWEVLTSPLPLCFVCFVCTDDYIVTLHPQYSFQKHQSLRTI